MFCSQYKQDMFEAHQIVGSRGGESIEFITVEVGKL